MTQEAVPLDERALQVARDAVKSVAAYNPMGDISSVAETAIRAYLQTALADVSWLVEPASMIMFSTKEGMLEHLVRERNKVASTLQTLSASNAALEAEIERLRGEMQRIVELDDKAYSVGDAARALGDVGRIARAALSAPKGGQDHG